MEERQPLRMRALGAGAGWSAAEFVCDAGPQDRAVEERHSGVSIAYVLCGNYRYRAAAGDAWLYPGAFLLGASGRCYACHHEHGRGDRCVSFNYDDGHFDEIAHAATGKLGFSFPAAALPALPALSPLGARMAAGALAPLAGDELAAEIAFAVARLASGASTPDRRPVAARDRARIAEVLRRLDEDSAAPWTLDRLACGAGLSRFHLLRTFARVTGLTPYRYLLILRLRRAAAALKAGDAPVSAIAYDEGFGDLSTFNAQFRRAFGCAPSRWRGRA